MSVELNDEDNERLKNDAERAGVELASWLVTHNEAAFPIEIVEPKPFVGEFGECNPPAKPKVTFE